MEATTVATAMQVVNAKPRAKITAIFFMIVSPFSSIDCQLTPRDYRGIWSARYCSLAYSTYTLVPGVSGPLRPDPICASSFPRPSPFGALFGRTQSKRGRGVSGDLEKLFWFVLLPRAPGHRVLLFRADRGLFSFNY